jgi:ribosomal protein L11 methyltransferase
MADERKREPGRVFEPFTIGGRFRIVPPDNGEPPRDGLIPLRMAPGAFGSGEHETTVACLELLAGLEPALTIGADAFDLGCGTGILAIAALKLGAARALCIDNDPDAVAACTDNGRLNGVTERLTCIEGTIADAPATGHHLVLANIYGDILLGQAEQIVTRALPEAMLILSGILHEQAFEVKNRYQRLGCTLRTTLMLGEFCALLLERAPRGDGV